MRTAFQRIAAEFIEASSQPLEAHPLAQFIRTEARDRVREGLPEHYQRLIVKGSPGQGNWANVPWVAVFDPSVTDSATRGYYVVYLFSADMRRVYLSLNQGTTAVHDEFGAEALDELTRRAGLMRTRVSEHRGRFAHAAIDLASDAFLPRGYEAGHAFGVEYDLAVLPSEDELATDLTDIVHMYLLLRSRGGVLPLEEGEQEDTGEQRGTVTERRRYRFHRSIERNRSASRRAKQVHGYICQGCGFDFEAVYGEVGREYIEAHHLTPLSELPDDQPVNLDPQRDFAVLCANCHRMVHRKNGPRTIGELRNLSGVKVLRVHFTK